MNWQENIIADTVGIRELLALTSTIAVLGIKTEAQAGPPAFYVPGYLHSARLQILSVPVYYPQVTHILKQKIYLTLSIPPLKVRAKLMPMLCFEGAESGL